MSGIAYKEPPMDVRHAKPETALFFRDFSEAKNSRDGERIGQTRSSRFTR